MMTWLLIEFALQISSHQQIEFLIGSAQLDICVERYRVVALHERIQKLVKRDRFLFAHSLCEIVAFEDLPDRRFRGELYEISRR